MYSPYEFFTQQFEKELTEICDKFDKLIEEEKVPGYQQRHPPKEGKFEWKSSKVDHFMRPHRYSPFFHINIGIDKINRKFQTRKEF